MHPYLKDRLGGRQVRKNAMIFDGLVGRAPRKPFRGTIRVRVTLPAAVASIACIIAVQVAFAGTPKGASSKPAGIPLNVDAAGAKGDRVTDDAAAMQAAFARSRNVTCTAGKTYYVGHTVVISADGTNLSATGCKFAPHLKPSTIPMFDVEANDVTLRGLHGVAGGGGWLLFAGMSRAISHVILNDETCDGSDSPPMSGCNQIGNVTDFRIDGWTDTATGYALLQKSGTNSHNVTVTHFRASDMYADLIEENSVTGVSTNWVISNGDFAGSHGYPKPATEQRFAGFTTADGITISNVTVQHANGDSAVHLEGSAKNIRLTNDTFKDNLSSGGADSYVMYYNSDNNITATQIKCIFASDGNAPYCFGGGANSYSNALEFRNVVCQDTTGLHLFGCFELYFHAGSTRIIGGGGDGLSQFIVTKGTTNLSVSGTTVTNSKVQ
jgi:hypothetical protein